MRAFVCVWLVGWRRNGCGPGSPSGPSALRDRGRSEGRRLAVRHRWFRVRRGQPGDILFGETRDGGGGRRRREERSLVQVGGLDLCLDPLLAQSVDDPGQVLAKHLTQLALDLALDEFLDDGNGVEGGVDVDVLERVGLEDEGDALLLGDDEDDDGAQLELGETEEHGDHEGLFGGEHAFGAREEVNVGLLVVQWVCLDLGLEDEMGVASVGETEDAAELVHGELPNLSDLELWWLRG